ncbi:histidine phosphatase family protein [Serratia proteamaculans]|uniref:histidine phosphatase family protein n=1 Tax=Serratia proteamaculans TaxID=28151 RepID=UPI0039BEBFB9
MRFIVLRHAESQWNREGIIQGRRDSPLTPAGHRQITALWLALQAMPISWVISSPAGRACATAQILAAQFNCPCRTDERLQEQSFGMLEGLSHAQALRDYPDAARRIFSGESEAWAPGGESTPEVAWRMASCLLSLSADHHNQTCCLVTHGHALQALIWKLKGEYPQDDLRQYSHHNCGYAIIDVNDGSFELVTWGVATRLLTRE